MRLKVLLSRSYLSDTVRESTRGKLESPTQDAKGRK